MTYDYRYVTSAQDLGRIAHEVSRAEMIQLDIETTSLDPRDGEIRLVQINTGKQIYIIDLWKTGTLGSIPEVLNNPNALTGEGRPLILGQNLKFEHKWLLHKYGIHLWPLFDTYRASAIISNGLHLEHNLGALYSRYLPELKAVKHEFEGGRSDWTKPELSEKQLQYAAEDVAHCDKLKEKLRAKLKKLRLLKIALLEFRAIWPEVAMELNGFAFNKEKWLALAKVNAAKAKEILEVLYRDLPDPYGQVSLPGMGAGFNINSPKQIMMSLNRMGVDIESTDSDTLAMVAKDFPITEQIILYRQYKKRCTTYGPDYLKNVRDDTGCIHTSYYPFTESGRYASSKPNLQQIPRTADFRSCFIAKEGWRLLVCDYGQIEVRLMAQASQDKVLLEIFRKGQDPYISVAANILGIPYEQVTKKQRQMAKPIVLGYMYGLGAKKMVIYAQSTFGVTMSLKEAQTHRATFFTIYKGVKRYQDHQWAVYKPQQLVYGMGGRLRYVGAKAHNEYVNTPIQAGGAFGFKKSLWNVYTRLLRKYGPNIACIIHMVHDEIIATCIDDDEIANAVQKDIEDGMKEAMKGIMPDVLCTADAAQGYDWSEAKD